MNSTGADALRASAWATRAPRPESTRCSSATTSAPVSRAAAARIVAGQEVTLTARLSEGPGQRHKLEAQLRDMLAKAGADPHKLSVEVLCAYKQGYSWLIDEIAPALAGKPVASVKIDFAKDVDPTNMRAMHTDARWVQELYPVDEMLARKLNIPLDRISLNRIDPPTIRSCWAPWSVLKSPSRSVPEWA